MEMTVGIKGTAEVQVTPENTAAALGSGLAPVFATPALVALMEKAAYTSVMPCLEEGYATVGTEMHIKHLAASPVGATIRAESELTGIDGRRLTFAIKAYDDAGLIGEAEHERFVLNAERFAAKAQKRVSL